MIQCPTCKRLYPDAESPCPHCGFTVPQREGFSAWAPALAYRSDSFKAEYFEVLASLESGNFWFRARNALIQWALRRYFPQLNSFLEVGCGTGFVLSGVAEAFPCVRLAGSELFAAGLACVAKRLPTVTLVQMDARAIPYVEEFDVVAAFDVIEHIREDDAVLQGLYRAVKPGGGLLLTVPQHRWLWSRMDELACHQRRYRARDLHRQLREAGFEILRSTSFVTLLLPLMMLSRRRMRHVETFDPRDELHLNPLLNRLLEAVLACELAWIRLGFNLPIGGSRLVVARRGLDANVDT